MLYWIRKATPARAAHRPDTKTLPPVLKAFMILEEHPHLILTSWTSNHSNVRLEGLNGIFQATRARVRDYRNVFNFMTMIYFIAAPLGKFIKFHR
ncbi:hypothetical protein DFAR_3720003 [Desulfarculales bacterium]